MLPYMAVGLCRFKIKDLWDEEIIQVGPVYYQESLNVEKGGRRVSVSMMQCEKDLASYCWLWRWRKRPQAGECRRLLASENSKEMLSSLESSGIPADALWPILDSASRTVKLLEVSGCRHLGAGWTNTLKCRHSVNLCFQSHILLCIWFNLLHQQ